VGTELDIYAKCYIVLTSVFHQLSISRYGQLSALIIQMMAILFMPFVVIAGLAPKDLNGFAFQPFDFGHN
jgi:hypothetical protein